MYKEHLQDHQLHMYLGKLIKINGWGRKILLLFEFIFFMLMGWLIFVGLLVNVYMAYVTVYSYLLVIFVNNLL
jgi:hypothetical protein